MLLAANPYSPHAAVTDALNALHPAELARIAEMAEGPGWFLDEAAAVPTPEHEDDGVLRLLTTRLPQQARRRPRARVQLRRGSPNPRPPARSRFPAPHRRLPPQAKIAQRIIPPRLRPVVLRDELVELGDLFRAYQQRDEPDLELLADLHERKARAFTTWADATSEGPCGGRPGGPSRRLPPPASSTGSASAASPAATGRP